MEVEIEKKKEEKKIRILPYVMGRFLLLGPTNHLFFHRAAQPRSYTDRLGPLARRAPAIMCSPLVASMWAPFIRPRTRAGQLLCRTGVSACGTVASGLLQPLRTETAVWISRVWCGPNKPGRSSIL
jgi:hypothetical protein